MNTDSPESEVLANIPEEFAERYERLLGAPGLRLDEATTRMNAYVANVAMVAALAPQVDLAMAKRLQAALTTLHQRHPVAIAVSAAVRYFLEEDDDDEITGVLGFQDDIAVVAAVCTVFEEPEILRELLDSD